MGLWRSWGKGNDLPFLCDPHLLSGKLFFSLSSHLFFLHGNGPIRLEYGWEAHERGRAKGHGRKAEQ